MPTETPKKFSKREKIGRYLFYTVLLSMAPFLLSAIYIWWIGYGFNLFKPEYIPDFVLITFAVAANVCGCATDIERNFSEKGKRGFAGLAVLSLLGCVFFYSLLLCIDEEALKSGGEQASRARILFFISAVFLLANASVGVIMEGRSS